MILDTFNGANIIQCPTQGYSDLQLEMNDAVAVSRSPWTQQTYVYPWSSQWWSAVLTFPPMSRTSIQPWQAFLAELGGQTNVFLLGSYAEAMPLGSFAPTNLVPDSNLADGWTFWGGAAPNANWSVVTNVYSGASGFQVASGDNGAAASNWFNVIPGQTYTLSAFIDLTGITVAGAGGPPAVEIQYLGGGFSSISPGLGSAARVSSTWTAPAGVTRVRIWVSLQGSTGSGSGKFAAFMLQPGSTLTSYVASQPLWLNSGGQSGNSITVAGFPVNASGLLLPGDNLQIGYRLYKVQEPVSSNGSGIATISIFPQLRDAPAAFTLVQTQMCQGLFRMSSNKRGYSFSPQHAYGLDPIQALEAL